MVVRPRRGWLADTEHVSVLSPTYNCVNGRYTHKRGVRYSVTMPVYSEDFDPPSALLTDKQRDFLLGNRDDISQTNKRATRRRIRRRLKVSVLDSYLIADKFDVDDIVTALSEPAKADDEVLQPIGSAVSSFAALLYLHANTYSSESDPGDQTHNAGRTERKTEAGIRLALRRLGYSAENVNVDITVETPRDITGLADDEELADLSRSTLQDLLSAGEISADEFAEAIMEQKE